MYCIAISIFVWNSHVLIVGVTIRHSVNHDSCCLNRVVFVRLATISHAAAADEPKYTNDKVGCIQKHAALMTWVCLLQNEIWSIRNTSQKFLPHLRHFFVSEYVFPLRGNIWELVVYTLVVDLMDGNVRSLGHLRWHKAQPLKNKHQLSNELLATQWLQQMD